MRSRRSATFINGINNCSLFISFSCWLLANALRSSLEIGRGYCNQNCTSAQAASARSANAAKSHRSNPGGEAGRCAANGGTAETKNRYASESAAQPIELPRWRAASIDTPRVRSVRLRTAAAAPVAAARNSRARQATGESFVRELKTNIKGDSRSTESAPNGSAAPNCSQVANMASASTLDAIALQRAIEIVVISPPPYAQPE